LVGVAVFEGAAGSFFGVVAIVIFTHILKTVAVSLTL
jgi:hypothetical protein